MLGSAQDAEDTLQETMLAAWQGLGDFQERASLRTWLYRIATSRCLNALRSARRRPPHAPAMTGFDLPDPTGRGEVMWLQPYPDAFLDYLPAGAPGPEAHYEAGESISLAFVTAVQLLPPLQRAVLVLRDVLGFSTRDVANMLDTTEQSTQAPSNAPAPRCGENLARQENSQRRNRIRPPSNGL
jgi:RNA polymerase sigma factor (sigma-70 family)